jgi:hypothetical protein
MKYIIQYFVSFAALQIYLPQITLYMWQGYKQHM